jgi:hypothetical protein
MPLSFTDYHALSIHKWLHGNIPHLQHIVNQSLLHVRACQMQYGVKVVRVRLSDSCELEAAVLGRPSCSPCHTNCQRVEGGEARDAGYQVFKALYNARNRQSHHTA